MSTVRRLPGGRVHDAHGGLDSSARLRGGRCGDRLEQPSWRVDRGGHGIVAGAGRLETGAGLDQGFRDRDGQATVLAASVVVEEAPSFSWRRARRVPAGE